MHDVNCADVGGPNRMGYAILTGPYRYLLLQVADTYYIINRPTSRQDLSRESSTPSIMKSFA